MNATEPAGRVDLVRNGEVRFALHRIPWQSAEDIMGPADELLTHLECSLGTPVPCAPVEGTDPRPVALVLHREVRAPLGREEFEVEATRDRIVLRARTVQAMYHAVYWFLEVALGVRWLWPGSSGRVIPEHRDLTYPIGVRRERPDYDWRAIQVGGACNRAMDLNTALHGIHRLPLAYLEEFRTWCRRNRLGGLNVADGHRWAEIAPPEVLGQTHPEYYALVDGERDCRPGDGKHGNQPCLSNPDVVRLMADYACASFEARQDLDVISLALNDGGKSCECPNCLAIDQAAGAAEIRAAEHFDRVTSETGDQDAAPRSITDRLFHHLDQVVERVRRRFPDRLLLTHLYSHYRRPPLAHRMPPEVIAQYCVMGAAFWNGKARDTELGRIRETGRRVARLGIYEYYSNGAWPEVHRLFPALVATIAREYHEAGARYYATQPSTGFAANGLNFYVLSRCLWDVRADPGAVMADFCDAGFGPASRAVHAFLEAFALRWRDTVSGEEAFDGVDRQVGFARLYPDGFLADREADLRSAEGLAAGDPQVLGRIDFLKSGLRYTTLYCAACRATGNVLEAGAVPNLKVLDPSALSAEARGRMGRLAGEAVSAWEAYWDFVRDNVGKFVFGEFWVHYRPGTFGAKDADLRKLRELAR